jgi:hypothetical protein
MARLSPSSNNSHHTTDPRREHEDDSNNNNNNNDDNDDDDQHEHEHEHDGPGLRISSPDYVDAHAAAAAPGQQSPVSTSSEGYPSWLPKRPPPPAPGSTLHSLSTAMMFDGGGGAGPADIPASAAASPSSGDDHQHHHRQPQTPVPFSGGRKPTPRSVRIVSMQDSNAASATGGGGGGGARREPTATPRVSSTAGATPSSHRIPSLPFLPLPSSLFRSRVWSRAKASALEGLSPTLLSSSQTPDARLRAAVAAPPKFRSPGLHLELLRDPSWKTRLHFYLFPLLVLAHLPLQSYLDFNAVYIMIE